MWDRKELKSRGKIAFKANYWRCVLVAAILSILTAASSSSARGDSDNSDLGQALSDASNASGISEGALLGIILGIIGVGLIIAIVINIFVKNVFEVGCKDFFLKNSDDSETKVKTILDPFKNNYTSTVPTMFMEKLFISLWSRLLIIPGIIKAYEYRMVPYILSENPEMGYKDILAKSKEMMNGNKWKAFVLDLSFIGWALLGAITLGIVAIFYTAPYVNATDAELYKALNN